MNTGEQYQENLFKGASASTFKNAHRLRQNVTKAESLLWQQLRNYKISGLKFRRQHPVDKFIADFYCAVHKVIVELDGGIHQEKEILQYDTARKIRLEQLGIRVLRFTNEEIEQDMDNVLKRIVEFVTVRSA